MFDIEALPIELFTLVIEHLIISIGIYKAFILRSVNRNFNSAILFVICDKQIINVNHSATWLLISRMPITPKGRVLLAKSRSREANINDAASVIAKVNQALDDLTRPSKEQQAGQHQMIAETVAYRYPRCINYPPHGIDWPTKMNRNVATNAHNVLMGAIIIGNLPLVKTLLEEQQTGINAINHYFGRPLEVAAVRGHLQIVRYLIDCGADPCRDDDGDGWFGFFTFHSRCAIGAAVRGGHEDVIQLLMQPEYTLSLTSAEYFRVLLDCIKFGRLHAIQSLLHASGKSLSDFTEFGSRMLNTAVENNQLDLVKMLLDGGIDVNSTLPGQNHYWNKILYLAASKGNPRMVQILLDHDACVDQAEYLSGPPRTPLEIASRRGHEEVVDILLAHSGGPVERAFICAADGGQTHLIDRLWKKDPQVHTRPWPLDDLSRRLDGGGDRGHTVGAEALYRAFKIRNPAVISLLVEHGVSLNENLDKRQLDMLQLPRWMVDYMVSLGAEGIEIDYDRYHCSEVISSPRGGILIMRQTWEWCSKY
ncbi:ankyrin repeat-containing domain protein [Daldinia vernicosa]|uniref:ankyrin repeat-containing domain protein n=1 Tax=Daldinia vernicosa TaxID=114800 RepID=UPI002007C4D2|nr:ankyrin repeat-containing domain protein [Daldinia vernicosa]KAI0854287.1 ankyrin repeat-containing domain protein [Daldinia vernicosa]